MNSNENVEVLNDLIKINNDRIEGYNKAIEQTDMIDADLRTLFENCRSTSEDIKGELLQKVGKFGGEPATDTTQAGKVYRVWMDVKKAISTKDRQAILESCEFGEDAAQRAYNEAIEQFPDLSNEVNEIIVKQKSTLKSEHDMVKKARDAQRAINS